MVKVSRDRVRLLTRGRTLTPSTVQRVMLEKQELKVHSNCADIYACKLPQYDTCQARY
jgi:hypothetical protein